MPSYTRGTTFKNEKKKRFWRDDYSSKFLADPFLKKHNVWIIKFQQLHMPYC